MKRITLLVLLGVFMLSLAPVPVEAHGTCTAKVTLFAEPSRMRAKTVYGCGNTGHVQMYAGVTIRKPNGTAVKTNTINCYSPSGLCPQTISSGTNLVVEATIPCTPGAEKFYADGGGDVLQIEPPNHPFVYDKSAIKTCSR